MLVLIYQFQVHWGARDICGLKWFLGSRCMLGCLGGCVSLLSMYVCECVVCVVVYLMMEKKQMAVTVNLALVVLLNKRVLQQQPTLFFPFMTSVSNWE